MMKIRRFLIFLPKELQKVNTKHSRFHMTGKNIDVKGKAIIGKTVGMTYSIQQLCGSDLNLCHLDIKHCWKKIKAMEVSTFFSPETSWFDFSYKTLVQVLQSKKLNVYKYTVLTTGLAATVRFPLKLYS